MLENKILPTIRFGTDGWRAIIGDGFTFANLERVAQAYADFIENQNINQSPSRAEKNFVKNSNAPLVVVGFDNRFLSEHFARRAAEVLAGNNIRVAVFNGAVPTPLVSWAVRESKAAGGVVITASHNSPEYNGFKIKADWGGSASENITGQVEALIDGKIALSCSSLANYDQPEITTRAEAGYRNQIENFIDLERLCSANIKIIADAMHGSGGKWIESFLQNGSIETETIRVRRDAFFGGVNPEPIDANLSALKKSVRTNGAILGLATDGDADRLGAVNELGETMTMHEVAPLLLLHLIRHRKATGGIVATFSQSVMMKKIARTFGLPFYETPIGFKYIAELMLRENILLGAEESGGIGLQGHIPERDGILNSLLFAEAVVAADQTPSQMTRELRAEFGDFYFDRCDLQMDVARGTDFVRALSENCPFSPAGERVVEIKNLDGTKLIFGDESWLLFRQSGTEPVLRVYTEATSKAKTARLLQAGIEMAHRGISRQSKKAATVKYR